jgi:hypothetical protein
MYRLQFEPRLNANFMHIRHQTPVSLAFSTKAKLASCTRRGAVKWSSCDWHVG